jgi:hypothetical protein
MCCFCLAGVLHENRGQAVVHAHLKNEDELQKLLDELREKLGPVTQVEPEPDKSMLLVSYSTFNHHTIFHHEFRPGWPVFVSIHVFW